MSRSSGARAALGLLVAAAVLVPAGTASAKKGETLEVCKHGCDFRTIQDAVDDSGKRATINVHPGTYREGVIVRGHKHDGLTIRGTKKSAKKVVLQGKKARVAGQPAQNGIEGDHVDGLRIQNMTATNYAANGFHVHQCDGYLMKNLRAVFNRAYGLFAFDCVGGRMTKSVGYGQGDSAWYVGATPAQKKPKWTKLDHLDAHENVLGYSGTNSKYVRITKSDFYNNGVGVVAFTQDSEPYEPTSNGIIENNNIFWNNFNYFLPASRVETVSDGLGTIPGTDLTIQFPTGAGIVLAGSDGWVVRNNNVFGNFRWGAAVLADPFNAGDDAIPLNNQLIDNRMGRDGADTNATDFFSMGAGGGNCFSGNVSSTFDQSATMPDAQLYPGCPAPPGTGGNGNSTGDAEQFDELAAYLTTSPPEKQECSWTKHSHPPFKKYRPLEIEGASC